MQFNRKQIMAGLMLAFAGMALFFNAPVRAQQSTPQPPEAAPTATPVVLREVSVDEVNAVARELYCPVCSNVPLDVCGTQACADWRELIRQKLAEGWSVDQIKMYFTQRYGDRVLPVPPNALIYLIPGAAILAAAIFVARMLSTRKAPAAQWRVPRPTGEPPAEDPYIARLEAELEKRKRK